MQKLECSAKASTRNVNDLVSSYDEQLHRLLSKPELEFLASTKLVLETIEESYTLLEVEYSKLQIKQTRLPPNARWVYLGGAPAYHRNKDCPRLHQDYLNFEIPSELPENQISAYRKFFIDNMTLLHEDSERFYFRVSMQFGLRTSQVRSVQHDNSGYDEMRNSTFNVEVATSNIRNHIAKMLEYKNSDPEKYKIIHSVGFATHKAMDYQTKRKYIDLDGEHPIKTWHQLKQELKTLLIDHIIATTNPELAFKKTILDAAGFTSCKECSAFQGTFKL
ncbi:hypothetical protein C4G81_RS16635 [Vibrio parahaemolyticus]|nr:hypothetical protein [Vibrio parahaemolyticus]EJG0691293.1 hypothetical protein [Vibrio parahaemolyticus]HCM0825209.1 hypothetical protein [Vibrio parahaemolyticus]HCM0974914.1 hypothetical protein [Vibrio parahaemolyticus]